jgi:hypothetical protein
LHLTCAEAKGWRPTVYGLPTAGQLVNSENGVVLQDSNVCVCVGFSHQAISYGQSLRSFPVTDGVGSLRPTRVHPSNAQIGQKVVANVVAQLALRFLWASHKSIGTVPFRI